MALRIVLSKGRLLAPSLNLLSRCGYDSSAVGQSGRRLISDLPGGLSVVVARPFDVPAYVEYGAADLGVVGKDVLMELGGEIFELCDLGFGECRFVCAGIRGLREEVFRRYERMGYLRVATKYPNVARSFFDKKGLQVEMVKLYGSVELAPLLGLADLIVDIMSTGRTISENNLEVFEEIAVCTARLVSNQVSYRINALEIDEFVKKVEEAVEEIKVKNS